MAEMVERLEPTPPREPYGKLFWRFLRFGMLAWGGPVAQIAMIREELVEEERWVSSEKFNRALALYQALPGPEAHELCVYFGMTARRRFGGFLAGAGFMLPGFVLIFLLSWLYVQYGSALAALAGLFYGMQPAVAALIVRAIHRIGQHALTDYWLWAIAILTGIADLLGTSFWVTLPFAGLAYLSVKREKYAFAGALGIAFIAITIAFSPFVHLIIPAPASDLSLRSNASLLALFGSGLRAGLLTFGGAYTAIPLLQHDAVDVNHWMTNAQFLDGIALGGILPAPLIIFGTFVGYIAGGAWGALVMTFGIFLPAFGFTLIGHTYLEKLIEHKTLQIFLDGLMAGVVGLIASAAITLFRTAVTDLVALGIFLIALLILYRWQAKAAVAVIMLAAGAAGLIFHVMSK